MNHFWLTMWTRPRSTIRAIVHGDPKYGVLFLAAINVAETLFYFSYYFSLGQSCSPVLLFFGILGFSLLIGRIWLYYSGWLLFKTGLWFGGAASALHLRTAFAWSKVPSLLGIFIWFILFLSNPDTVFIRNTLSVIINPTMFILGIWSLVILIQEVRELQSFSFWRSLINVLVSNSLSFFILIAAILAIMLLLIR